LILKYKLHIKDANISHHTDWSCATIALLRQHISVPKHCP